MKISAVTPFSMIDFPGEISCIVFTPGCNMRCLYCHNSEFVLPEKLKRVYQNLISEDVFFKFLESRKGLLSGVSICGGEPSIHPGLKDFCTRVKSMGFKVKLDTNGQNPELIQELLSEKLIDYIAMDIKHEEGRLSEIIGVSCDEEVYNKTIRYILTGRIEYEFRTTVISGVHNEQSIENICKSIQGAKRYALQNYRGGNSLDPSFLGKSHSDEMLGEFEKIAKRYINEVIVRK